MEIDVRDIILNALDNEGYFAGVFMDNIVIAILITVLLVQNNLI